MFFLRGVSWLTPRVERNRTFFYPPLSPVFVVVSFVFLGAEIFVSVVFSLLSFPHINSNSFSSLLQEFADFCKSLYWCYDYYPLYWGNDCCSVTDKLNSCGRKVLNRQTITVAACMDPTCSYFSLILYANHYLTFCPLKQDTIKLYDYRI